MNNHEKVLLGQIEDNQKYNLFNKIGFWLHCSSWTVGPRTFIYGSFCRSSERNSRKILKIKKFLKHCHGNLKNSPILHRKQLCSCDSVDVFPCSIPIFMPKMNNISHVVFEIYSKPNDATKLIISLFFIISVSTVSLTNVVMDLHEVTNSQSITATLDAPLLRDVMTSWVHSAHTHTYFYRPRSEGDNALGSVRPSVHLFVCLFGFTQATFDLRPSKQKMAIACPQKIVCLSVISWRVATRAACSGRSAF